LIKKGGKVKRFTKIMKFLDLMSKIKKSSLERLLLIK